MKYRTIAITNLNNKNVKYFYKIIFIVSHDYAYIGNN